MNPTTTPPQEAIELLPVSLLDAQRPTVSALSGLAQSLGLEFGWHYLLDLTWILQLLGEPAGKTILDAGAGTGILQWYLAENNAAVLSVDRASRSELTLRFRRRYRVRGLHTTDLAPASQALGVRIGQSHGLPAKLRTLGREISGLANFHRAPGSVAIYNQDLKSLVDIPESSVDAVVGVSALEHNPPDELPLVVAELMRILKPGGVLLATLCAARDQDWFHQPSQGWCYTEASLRHLFDLPAATANYQRYDELLAALRDCAELRDNLASFYARSGDNGMPWGKWDPQYQPVGVCKIKS